MRVLAALTLLFAVSCTFDYGPLRGTAQDDASVWDASDDGADFLVDAPLWPDTPADQAAMDTAADVVSDTTLVDWDVAPDVERAADVPASEGVDAAAEAGPALGGAGGGLGTGGTGGSTGQGGVSGTGVAFDGGQYAPADGAREVAPELGRDVADANAERPAKTDVYKHDASGGTETCGPEQNACVDNVYSSCSCGTNGTGCTITLQDCGPTSVCDLALGGCVVVDSTPFDPNDTTAFSSRALTSAFKMNVYSVGAARTLLRIEQYLSMPAETPLHWVIYRSSTKEGAYVLDQTFDNVGTASAGGYQSSPILNYALQANTYYAIGLWWNSGPAGYWYHTSAAPFPIELSPTGGLSLLSALSSSVVTTTTPPSVPASVAWSSSSTLYYPQRLSTR